MLTQAVKGAVAQAAAPAVTPVDSLLDDMADGNVADREETLERNVLNHFAAIETCLANNYRMPALVLIYAGIDIFASLGRPKNQPDVTRQDFLNWCNRYLIPAGFTHCQAIDLYGARCGVIHTYTSQSKLSRTGKAKQVLYAWGNRTPQALQSIIDSVGMTSHVVIHIDELLRSLRAAAANFLEEVHSDAARWTLVVERSQSFFMEYTDPI